jgi:hypothetical protein
VRHVIGHPPTEIDINDGTSRPPALDPLRNSGVRGKGKKSAAESVQVAADVCYLTRRESISQFRTGGKMRTYIRWAIVGVVGLGLAACGEGGGKSASSAAAFKVNGVWEGEFPDNTDTAGTLKSKGKVTLSDNVYTYSWYKKLVGPDNATVYDWTETARETGSASFAPDYMEWTADSFGEAEFNDGTKTWSSVAMKPSKNEYAIQYTVEGNKLTLKEDINMDGDFDDVFESPETLTYTKIN